MESAGSMNYLLLYTTHWNIHIISFVRFLSSEFHLRAILKLCMLGSWLAWKTHKLFARCGIVLIIYIRVSIVILQLKMNSAATEDTFSYVHAILVYIKINPVWIAFPQKLHYACSRLCIKKDNPTSAQSKKDRDSACFPIPLPNCFPIIPY